MFTASCNLLLLDCKHQKKLLLLHQLH